jgi:molybdopterin synthase sulfur carrier subunit
MIDVRFFATLVEPPGQGRRHFQMEARPGLTVRAVLAHEAVPEAAVHIIMVNGMHGGLDSPLRDGDRLGVFPPVGGG